MPTLYDFVLNREDTMILVAILGYDKESCDKRIGELEDDTSSEENRREIESRMEEMRVIRLVEQQYNDQVVNGPMISFEVRLDLTEPLQNALVAQLSYAIRQRDGYARLVAAAPDSQDIRDDYNAYRRQVEALTQVIKQVGRHV